MSIRKTALLGGNPKVRQREEEGRATTFAEMARRVHERKFKDNKSNGKHIAQWITTLETYAFSHIGDLSVEDVSQDDIEKVLDPIWSKKPETARRVLQRISTVFDHACGSGYRTKGNPATGLGKLMRNQGHKPKHFEALAYDDVTALMTKLEAQTVVGAMALKFTILTAARSGPVRFATWEQFDENLTKWTVPEENMKGREPFNIPLSTHAHSLITQVKARAPKGAKYIFYSPKDPQKPISENTMRKFLQGLYPGATVHGMRAAFRIWAEVEAHARNEVAEVSLAHTVASKTVAAYLRTDYFDEREKLMEKWGMWVMGEWEWFGDGRDIDGEV